MEYCHECAQFGLEYELNLAGISYFLTSNSIKREFYVECKGKRFIVDFSQSAVIITYGNVSTKLNSFNRIIEIIKEQTK